MNDAGTGVTGLPGGVPLRSSEGDRLLRGIVDMALVTSRIPGSLEPTSGGTYPSTRLANYLAAALLAMYEATSAPDESMQEWLGLVLELDIEQVPSQGSTALARQLQDAASGPDPTRLLVPFTVEEDAKDKADSARARDEFGTFASQQSGGTR